MSHISKIELEVKDLGVLAQACAALVSVSSRSEDFQMVRPRSPVRPLHQGAWSKLRDRHSH